MILITRPKVEANQFADELNKKNLISIIDPILKFEPLKKNIQLSQNRIYIITSSQCVKSLDKYSFELIESFISFIGGKLT